MSEAGARIAQAGRQAGRTDGCKVAEARTT